jgi:hypothetical protein
VLRCSKISEIHSKIWLMDGIFVIMNNYKNAIHKPNFRMNSENFATLKYYP